MHAWTDTLAAAQYKLHPLECAPRPGHAGQGPSLGRARRPGALWAEAGGGRVAVAGSAEMFSDAWLAAEGNGALLAWLLAWLQPARGLSAHACAGAALRASRGCPGRPALPVHARAAIRTQGLLQWGCFGMPTAELGATPVAGGEAVQSRAHVPAACPPMLTPFLSASPRLGQRQGREQGRVNLLTPSGCGGRAASRAPWSTQPTRPPWAVRCSCPTSPACPTTCGAASRHGRQPWASSLWEPWQPARHAHVDGAAAQVLWCQKLGQLCRRLRLSE